MIGNWIDILEVSYPESGYGTEIIYDACINCFETKIIPFMTSLGVETRVIEWDY